MPPAICLQQGGSMPPAVCLQHAQAWSATPKFACSGGRIAAHMRTKRFGWIPAGVAVVWRRLVRRCGTLICWLVCLLHPKTTLWLVVHPFRAQCGFCSRLRVSATGNTQCGYHHQLRLEPCDSTRQHFKKVLLDLWVLPFDAARPSRSLLANAQCAVLKPVQHTEQACKGKG